MLYIIIIIIFYAYTNSLWINWKKQTNLKAQNLNFLREQLVYSVMKKKVLNLTLYYLYIIVYLLFIFSDRDSLSVSYELIFLYGKAER